MDKSFIQFIFKGINEGNPNHAVQAAFDKMFPNSNNFEWTFRETYFECIFIDHSTEFIARFTEEGALISLHENIKPESVPNIIKNQFEKDGQTIMSAIKCLHENQNPEYELIIKDQFNIRHLYLTDISGRIIEHRSFPSI
jgi:hypothetical protein